MRIVSSRTGAALGRLAAPLHTLDLSRRGEADLAQFVLGPPTVVDGSLERLDVVLLRLLEGFAGLVEGAASSDRAADVVHPVVEQPLGGFLCLLGVSELRHAPILTDAHDSFERPRLLRWRFAPVVPQRSKAMFYVP